MKRFTLLLTLVLVACTAMAQQVVMPRSRTAGRQVHFSVKAPAHKAELRDENGVITAPADGEQKVYKRQGGVVIPVGFDVSEGQQSGDVTLVFCDDGTVYMQHPLSETLEHTKLDPNTWIKGTMSGDEITFPSQVIGYTSTFRCTVSIALGEMDVASGNVRAIPDRKQDIVFKVKRSGKIIELQNTDRNHVLGAFYDKDDDSYYYWDFATQLVYDTTGERGEAVTPPAGLQQTTYIASGYDAAEVYDAEVEASYSIGNVTFNSCLGFDGDDVYMSNFSYYGVGHWLKGRRQADGSLVFPKEQYVATLNDEHYDLYFYALPHGSTNAAEACDLVLTYDPVKRDYISGQDLFISYEKMGSTLERAECLENFRLLSFNDVEPAPILKAPAGYRQLSYLRYGKCLSNLIGWFDAEQVPDYSIDIAYNPNGKDVYMLSPIGAGQLDVWIKGTIEDDGKLHVPTQQWLQQDPEYGNIRTGVFAIKWVNKSRYQYTYEWAPDIKEVTFTIDEDGFLTLDPLAADDKNGEMPPLYTYGMVRGTDEYSWCGLSDAYTIYTPIEGSEIIVGGGEVDPGVDPEPDDDVVDITTPVPGEEKNEYGIIVTPGTGEETTYTRSGENYHAEGGDVISGKQDGVAHIVECEDGVVYLQQPVSTYTSAWAATSWIRGVRRNDQLIFPAAQPVSYHAYYEEAVGVFMGQYIEGEGIVADTQKNIIFDISDEGKTLSLAGSNNVTPVGVFYCNGGEWTGCGDYRTVLTYKSGGHTEQAVEPGWKAERIAYTLTGTDFEEGGKGYNALLAFDDDDTVYLGNFCFWADYYHEMNDKYIWVKGRKNADGSLVFPKEQFLFTYSYGGTQYDLFFYGATENRGGYSIADITFVYDAVSDAYIAQQDILVTWGRVTTSIPRAEQLTGVVLRRDNSDGTRPYIITEQPEGTLYSYHRSGTAFGYDDYGQVGMCQQDSDIDIVISHDGKYVYMHNPISEAIPVGGSWVSGTVDDAGNLHFPTMQWIDFNDELGYGARTAAMVLVEGSTEGSVKYMMVPNVAEMSFTFNPATGTYSLDRLEGIDYETQYGVPRLIYGVVWSDTYEWAGYGDHDSVYTPNFKWDDTGIASVGTTHTADTYYDFQGRSVRPDARGLVIKSGRKVMR